MMEGFMVMEKFFLENEKPGFIPVSHANPSRVIHLQAYLGLV
jgi:hypothetical protein